MDVLRAWEWTKNFLSDELQLTHAMLHVHVGLGLFVLFTLLLRRPPGSALPALLVFLVEASNEVMDFSRYHESGWPWIAAPTVHDLIETLLWPVVLTGAARLHRVLAPAQTHETGISAPPAGPDLLPDLSSK
jgi:hypothetical protein